MEQRIKDGLTQLTSVVDVTMKELPEQLHYARIRGFEPACEEVVVYENGAFGLLIRRPDQKKNNAVYVLKEDEETPGNYMFIVVVPSTIDRTLLVEDVVRSMKQHYQTLPAEDFEMYDMMVVFTRLMEELCLKPLSKSLYPNDAENRVRFEDNYLTLLLNSIQGYHQADENDGVMSNFIEELVNSGPHQLKEALARGDKDDQ